MALTKKMGGKNKSLSVESVAAGDRIALWDRVDRAEQDRKRGQRINLKNPSTQAAA